VSGGVSQQKKLDTIANNLANVDTTGFKKDDVVFREYLTALENPEKEVIDIPRKEFELKDFYHHHGNDKSLVKTDGTYTKFKQGALKQTGNPLDLAIEGNGFLEVLSPQGVRYSRQGDLKLSQGGVLVNKDGFPVLSKIDPAIFQQEGLTEEEQQALAEAFAPENRTIELGRNARVKIGPEGRIFKNGQQLAELSLIEFTENAALRKEGHGLFLNLNEANISREPSGSRIHQGYLETSNVNPILEMTNLIKTQRLYENANKAIQSYNNMEQQAIQLGKIY
jgi:flagellar basal-body rod protein FlgG